MGMIMHDDVPYGEGTSYTQGTGIVINNNIIAVDADNTPTAGSEKPVKSKGVFSALEANKEESASLLKSTVGWTGKNLLKYPYSEKTKTASGITFTDNGDGSVTVNGTSTAGIGFILMKGIKFHGKYIISKNANINNVKLTVQAYQNDSYVKNILELSTDIQGVVDFDYAEYDEVRIQIWITSGSTISNATIYPMLRDASISDDTYEPYHSSVEQTLRDAEVIEGKNKLHIPDSVVTQTINDVTFTVNRNSDGEVTSVVANGTASAQTDLYIGSTLNLIPNKSYKLSGCPSGGSSSTYHILVKRFAQNNPYDSGNGLDFSVESSDTYHDVYIRVQSGIAINNLTFSPMIRDASEADSTFEPFYIPLKDSKFDRAEQRVLGAKNVLNNTANTQTIKGITFTVNSDKSVTLNGTSDEDWATLRLAEHFTLPSGYYTISGIKGGSQQTYRLSLGRPGYNDIVIYDGETTIYLSNAVEINNVSITVRTSGTIVNNVTIYPMIRLASDPDDTYAPYAMTNRELTEAVKAVDAKIYCNWLPNGESVTVGEQIYNGGVVFVWKGSDNGQYCFDRTSNVSAIKAMTGITVVSNGYNNTVTNVTISNSKGEGVFVAVISG